MCHQNMTRHLYSIIRSADATFLFGVACLPALCFPPVKLLGTRPQDCGVQSSSTWHGSSWPKVQEREVDCFIICAVQSNAWYLTINTARNSSQLCDARRYFRSAINIRLQRSRLESIYLTSQDMKADHFSGSDRNPELSSNKIDAGLDRYEIRSGGLLPSVIFP
jgi:hypothetical protein